MKGTTFFTGHWPHEKVDFSGRRVGAIAYQNACADEAAKGYGGFTRTAARAGVVTASMSERPSIVST